MEGYEPNGTEVVENKVEKYEGGEVHKTIYKHPETKEVLRQDCHVKMNNPQTLGKKLEE